MNNISFSLLIDTNAVGCLTLYIEACDSVSKKIGITVDELLKQFEYKGYPTTILHVDELKKGFKFLNYLKDKISKYGGSIEILIPLFSEFEMLKLISEKIIERKFTQNLISFRLRKNKFFKSRSFFDYEKEVYGYWEAVKQRLDDENIEFLNPEDRGKNNDAIKDIITIARILNRHIILDSGDLYIYASAIYIRANEIYTNDGELRNTIHDIKTNGIEEWKSLRNDIINDLLIYIPSFKEEYDLNKKIELPDAIH